MNEVNELIKKQISIRVWDRLQLDGDGLTTCHVCSIYPYEIKSQECFDSLHYSLTQMLPSRQYVNFYSKYLLSYHFNDINDALCINLLIKYL
jgi:hypothetical protein